MSRSLFQFLSLWSVVLLGKIWSGTADADALSFLLYPTSKLLSLLQNLPFQYLPDQGYLFPEVQVLISPACSGINFLLIATLTAGFSLLGRYGQRYWFLPVCLILAYALTILGNVARISVLLFLEPILSISPALHLALGAATYLSILIPFSFCLQPTLCLPKPKALPTAA